MCLVVAGMAITTSCVSSVFSCYTSTLKVIIRSGNTLAKTKSNEVWVLFSGGLDSSALTHFYLNQNSIVKALFVRFGQPAERLELQAARQLSAYFDVELFEVQFRGILEKNSGLIQARNLFLIAVGLMEMPTSASVLALGIHSGTAYPDCSPRFARQIENVIALYSGGAIQLGVPFLKWNKQQIINYSLENNIPVSKTYSCEKGKKLPCGKCLSCRDREHLDVG